MFFTQSDLTFKFGSFQGPDCHIPPGNDLAPHLIGQCVHDAVDERHRLLSIPGALLGVPRTG